MLAGAPLSPEQLLTDGWHLDAWLLPTPACDRCGSTIWGCRIPDKFCDQCVTPADFMELANDIL